MKTSGKDKWETANGLSNMLTRAPEVRLKQKQKTSRNNGQNFPKLDENISLHTEVQLIPRRIQRKPNLSTL